MPRIRLEWASEGTRSILTFTVSFLLSRDWTHWCSVCFSYPAQQQDNSSPHPRHHRSIRPSLSSILPPPTPAIWKHQSILQATVPSHSLGGQLSFITHCAVRQQHWSIFQFHNRVREEGGGGDNKLNKSSKKEEEEEVGVTKSYGKRKHKNILNCAAVYT